MLIHGKDELPNGYLNTAVDQLVEHISTSVLGKRKFESSDIVAIGDSKELNCSIFEKLRGGEWFDAWTIFAGMTMSDKSPFVKYDYSIPLEESGRNGRMKAIKKPLRRWREKIDIWRSEAQSTEEDILQVYFCPLNHNNNHFSLLEINELERKIYHYDSMAADNVINRTIAFGNTKVGRLIQVITIFKMLSLLIQI
jgi:Ulp1 protease family, C-terminal catalytic domain